MPPQQAVQQPVQQAQQVFTPANPSPQTVQPVQQAFAPAQQAVQQDLFGGDPAQPSQPSAPNATQPQFGFQQPVQPNQTVPPFVAPRLQAEAVPNPAPAQSHPVQPAQPVQPFNPQPVQQAQQTFPAFNPQSAGQSFPPFNPGQVGGQQTVGQQAQEKPAPQPFPAFNPQSAGQSFPPFNPQQRVEQPGVTTNQQGEVPEGQDISEQPYSPTGWGLENKDVNVDFKGIIGETGIKFGK
ncbi:hypothetical protein D3C71_1537260 [compost metagenome]